MTVYVDPLKDWGWKLGSSCHMMSDGDEAELHALANKIGLRRYWFQGDHYDLTDSKRLLAIKYGAVECGFKKVVGIRRAAREVKIAAAPKANLALPVEVRSYLYECVVCGINHECPKCAEYLTSLLLCTVCGVRYTHTSLGLPEPS